MPKTPAPLVGSQASLGKDQLLEWLGRRGISCNTRPGGQGGEPGARRAIGGGREEEATETDTHTHTHTQTKKRLEFRINI